MGSCCRTPESEREMQQRSCKSSQVEKRGRPRSAKIQSESRRENLQDMKEKNPLPQGRRQGGKR